MMLTSRKDQGKANWYIWEKAAEGEGVLRCRRQLAVRTELTTNAIVSSLDFSLGAVSESSGPDSAYSSGRSYIKTCIICKLLSCGSTLPLVSLSAYFSLRFPKHLEADSAWENHVKTCCFSQLLLASLEWLTVLKSLASSVWAGVHRAQGS